MDCSMPGLPVHRQFLDFTQTHILWVGDAIQPPHPLSSPSCLTFNLSQHQCLFKWVSSSHQVAKVSGGYTHSHEGLSCSPSVTSSPFPGPLSPSRRIPPLSSVFSLFIIGDWDAKVGNQEIPGVTSKFGLGVQNEARQRLTEFCQEKALVTANNTRKDSTHGHHQMVNNEIRLIIFFAAEDGQALYSQQKQDQELTVAQIMSFLLQNSDLNWRK